MCWYCCLGRWYLLPHIQSPQHCASTLPLTHTERCIYLLRASNHPLMEILPLYLFRNPPPWPPQPRLFHHLKLATTHTGVKVAEPTTREERIEFSSFIDSMITSCNKWKKNFQFKSWEKKKERLKRGEIMGSPEIVKEQQRSFKNEPSPNLIQNHLACNTLNKK